MFVKLQMQGVSMHSLWDDPLAGCWPLVQETANGTNLLRSLLLRLRIYYTGDTATAIGDQIINESLVVTINRWEYMINECLHELRVPAKGYSPAYEVEVLNKWIADLMSRHDQDLVLEWVSMVKRNREHRKR